MQDWREAEFDKIDRAIADVREEDSELNREERYQAALADFQIEVECFDLEHPRICEKCGGSGTVTSHQRRDPVDDVCPDCLGQGLCPYCGQPIMEQIPKNGEWVNNEDDLCLSCGWSTPNAGESQFPLRPVFDYDPD
jgi:hypothetical protein